MTAILDFGCGSGRLLRWWADVSGPQIHGCDYNRRLVSWCDAHPEFAEVRATELAPPLPYDDASFDFLYALSVFTHLTIDLSDRWFAEIARIVKPGGLFWFTVHGESYTDRLLASERDRFDTGEPIVHFPEIEGTNLCSVFWPRESIARLLADRFEIVGHLDPCAPGTVASDALLEHDSYLVRRLS